MKTQVCTSRSWYLVLSLLAVPAMRLAVAQDANFFPTVTIHATDPMARESGSDSGTFTVRRTGPTNLPLAVFYHLSGSASNGVDYEPLGSSVQIPAGAIAAALTVKPIDDSLVEGIEWVVVRLTGSPLDCATCGYNIGEPGAAEISILDNDLAGTNHPPFVRLNEPQDGDVFTAPANITLHAYARDAEDRYWVKVEFFEGTNSLGFGIFQATTCPDPYCPYYSLTWSNVPPGQYTLTATATDANGGMAVSIPARIVVGETNLIQPVVNIFATDDTGSEIPVVPPWLGMVQEADPIVFTVTRTGPTDSPLTVFYGIGGTASNGLDYFSGSAGTYSGLQGHVTIPAGARLADITVEVIDDLLVEGTEIVELTLGPPVWPCFLSDPPCLVANPPFYVIGPSNHVVANILDNDLTLPPVVTIVASDPDAAESGLDTGRFTVSRTGDTSTSLGIFYTVGGTAEDGVDYLALDPGGFFHILTGLNFLEISAGAHSADIVVTPIDDHLAEGSESVLVQLRPQVWWPVVVGAPSNAVVTITDNDLVGTNWPPAVEMIRPVSGETFMAGTGIQLVAFAQDTEDHYNLQVEFFEGTHTLGFGSFFPGRCSVCPNYGLVWSNVPPGEYTLTAKATDSAGASTISVPVHITVRGPNTPPGAKLWEFSAGIVYGSAAVGGDGTVYVPAGNAIVNLYALTPSGDTKWVQNLAGGGSSPAIADDGTIYVARFDGQNTFRAYNPDGTVRWSIPLNVAGTFLGASSPAIARDGTIYVGGEGSLDKGLHALRPDGTLKWKFVPAGTQVLTPVVGTDGTIYFGASNDGLYAVNPDGTQRWNLPMTGNHIWAVVGGDGTIYVVGSISPTKLFAFAPDGVKKWESQIGPETSQYSSAPVIGLDGTIFVVSDRLYAFNRDGSGKWAFAPPANLGHSAVSPAVDSQGNVYAGLGGSFVAVSASGSLLWSFATGGPTFTAPTLTPNGIVYVGAGDIFYAFQANAGLAESPWPMFQRDTRHSGAAPPTNLLPVVNIVARDPFASEGTNFWRDYPDANVWAAGIWNFWHVNIGGTNTATFVVRRHGSTSADLTVNYEIAGTASNGVDYLVLPGSITIAAGKHSARIVVVPRDDVLAEGIETVVLRLKPSADYTVGFSSHTAAFIIDSDRPRPQCVMLRDRRFHLCRPATNGFCFRVGASTDLRNWIPICTNVVTDGALHFVDPDPPPLNLRFYRVEPEPGLPPDD